MTLEFKGQAAILEGGPRDGWAYFIKDLEEMQRIAEWAGRTFAYVPTDRTRVHPQTNGKITSAVWVYQRPADEPPDPAEELRAEVLAQISLMGRGGGNIHAIMHALAELGPGLYQVERILKHMVGEGLLESSGSRDTHYRTKAHDAQS